MLKYKTLYGGASVHGRMHRHDGDKCLETLNQIGFIKVLNGPSTGSGRIIRYILKTLLHVSFPDVGNETLVVIYAHTRHRFEGVALNIVETILVHLCNIIRLIIHGLNLFGSLLIRVLY